MDWKDRDVISILSNCPVQKNDCKGGQSLFLPSFLPAQKKHAPICSSASSPKRTLVFVIRSKRPDHKQQRGTDSNISILWTRTRIREYPRCTRLAQKRWSVWTKKVKNSNRLFEGVTGRAHPATISRGGMRVNG